MNMFDKAKEYVGNDGINYDIVGDLQLELLKINGCNPNSDVLDIGCGCLVAGHIIIPYLNPGKYVGVDPNKWLIDAALENIPDLKNKLPTFLYNNIFSAAEINRNFDFVISHSVLSHAAEWQLPQFLTNIRVSLNPLGKIIASIRITDYNKNPQRDSHAENWTYPNAIYFSWDTIKNVSSCCRMNVEWVQKYRDMFVEKSPSNYHDWLVFTKR